jgi:hypothetical protein
VPERQGAPEETHANKMDTICSS